RWGGEGRARRPSGSRRWAGARPRRGGRHRELQTAKAEELFGRRDAELPDWTRLDVADGVGVGLPLGSQLGEFGGLAVGEVLQLAGIVPQVEQVPVVLAVRGSPEDQLPVALDDRASLEHLEADRVEGPADRGARR